MEAEPGAPFSMDSLYSIANAVWSYGILFLIVLTVIVFVHELGHFLLARWNGVTVKAFSIGFGPEIFGFDDRYGTRWRFAAIPLGGYVKFIDDENAASAPGTETKLTLTPEERAGAFHKKTVGQRAAVVAAGPIANFILAIVIYTALNLAVGVRITPAQVDTVVAGSAAEKAGILAGDKIVAINGEVIESFGHMQQIVAPNAGETLVFSIDRNGQTLSINLTPKTHEEKDPFGRTMRRGLVGIQQTKLAEKTTILSVGPIEAVTRAVSETYGNIARSIGGLRDVLTTRQSHEQLGGPILMAEVTAKVAEAGFEPILRLMAFMSASIGMLNLLPIPVLDGGHLLFYGYEAIRRKPPSERFQQMGLQFGFALLMLFILFVNLNDILIKLRSWTGTG
jgi:regulator of sigma E protease